MKKIGEGWQYSVYDLDNGRVLKEFHSWPRAFWVVLKTIFPFNEEPFWKIPQYTRSVRRKAVVSFAIIKSGILPNEWIGNPKFLDGLDFEQDKVTPIHDIFEQSSLADSKKIVDDFIIFNEKLLARGIIDKGFSIAKNFGVNSKGEIILTDIGELFNDTDRIHKQRRARIWTKSYVAGYIKNQELRQYFIDQMDNNFGLQ